MNVNSIQAPIASSLPKLVGHDGVGIHAPCTKRYCPPDLTSAPAPTPPLLVDHDGSSWYAPCTGRVCPMPPSTWTPVVPHAPTNAAGS